MSKLKIKSEAVVSFFDANPQNIFRLKDLRKILDANRYNFGENGILTERKFLKYLIEETSLKKIVLDFPSRIETRYVWGEVSLFELLLSAKKDSYFSHYTAMSFNNLTNQIPKNIYLNQEQRKLFPIQNRKLEQTNIDLAFRNKSRVTNNIITYENYKIFLLNGKKTENLGVVEISTNKDEKIKVTNIERTLIDIVVRPIYSGGVFEVLEAYKRAKEIASINKLISYLKKIDFIYPYHQAIGFYLERADYSETQISLLESLGVKQNFYLDYKMVNPEFSTRWNLYYPRGL